MHQKVGYLVPNLVVDALHPARRTGHQLLPTGLTNSLL